VTRPIGSLAPDTASVCPPTRYNERVVPGAPPPSWEAELRVLRTAGLLVLVVGLTAAATVGALLWGLPLVGGVPAAPAMTVASWPAATSERTVAAPTREITIVAVGDLMGHSPQRDSAKTASGYDFAPCFSAVATRVAEADLAIGNLETPLAGADAGYSGYPAFNNPDDYAVALGAAGFDVLTTANNHCLDRGMSGLVRTREVLESLGIASTGTARSEDEADTLLMRDVSGVNVAILAYTYGMNGFTAPAGKDWAVNTIDREAMTAAVADARAQGADIVIVSIHNGIEYEREPSTSQEALELAMVAAGADVVLGSHPHVIQPMEVVEATREDGTPREALIIHSLGNFVSGQRQRFRDAGLILSFSFEKDLGTGVTRLTGVEYVPTWVDSADDTGTAYRVLPIAEVLADADYPGVTDGDRQRMAEAYADTAEHLGENEVYSRDPASLVFWGERVWD